MSPAQIRDWVAAVLREHLQRDPTDGEIAHGLAVYAARLEERVSAGFERRAPAEPSRPPKPPPKEPIS